MTCELPGRLVVAAFRVVPHAGGYRACVLWRARPVTPRSPYGPLVSRGDRLVRSRWFSGWSHRAAWRAAWLAAGRPAPVLVSEL